MAVKKLNQQISLTMKKKPNLPPVIYTNNHSLKLYMVSLLILSLSVFVFYMIFSDLDDFYKEYSSKLSGTMWMIFMIVLGNAMFVCMLWLSGRYVLKIEHSEERFVSVKTWSILGLHKTEKYPKSILDNIKYYPGYTHIRGTPAANAPWFKLKTPKGKILVIDTQGHFSKKVKNFKPNQIHTNEPIN